MASTTMQERLEAAESIILDFILLWNPSPHHPKIERWRKARRETMEEEMNSNDQRLLDRAAAAAMSPQVVQHQAAPQQQPTLNLIELVNAGILQPKQVFDFIKAQYGDAFPFEWQDTREFDELAEMKLIMQQQTEAVNRIIQLMETPMSPAEIQATFEQAMTNVAFPLVSAPVSGPPNLEIEKGENECEDYWAPKTPSS